MLEPEKGVVFDPCCGSGGMFVQSDLFTKHSHQLSFVGQESKDFTYRLCRMNLFIHGLDGNIQLGNSYFDDQHATLKADYVLANPPFNDGSKGENGWGADRIADKDPRLTLGGAEDAALAAQRQHDVDAALPLSISKEGGTAGFVMATGELSNSETARLEVRKALVEQDYVDCIVQLTGQLFANTQIPCSLWFLSKNRKGGNGYRQAKGRDAVHRRAEAGNADSWVAEAEAAAPRRRSSGSRRPTGNSERERAGRFPGFCAVGEVRGDPASRIRPHTRTVRRRGETRTTKSPSRSDFRATCIAERCSSAVSRAFDQTRHR